jgi:hypothetical protein
MLKYGDDSALYDTEKQYELFRVSVEHDEVKKARLCRRVEWQRPIFPEGYPSSIIGAERLNCRVRDGNGCFPFAIVTTPPACTCSILNRIERISKENTLVETRGFEPLTSAVQRRRSSN